MGQAQVKVKYVNPPKPGKVNGSIKDITDDMYGVPPNLLATFQQGATYNIEFSERVFNGARYKTVTRADLIAAPEPTVENGGKYAPKDQQTAERIFVCGALNAAIQGGHVELSDVTLSNVVNVLRSVWKHTLGAPPGKNDDMGGDDFPF